jgi:crotonobetainyl-CoA hydratase
MNGCVIDLEQAKRWGLVNAVIPTRQLYKKGQALAAEIALSAPLAVSISHRRIPS